MKKNYITDPQLLVTLSGIYFLLYMVQYNDNFSIFNGGNFPNFMLISTIITGMFLGDKMGSVFGFFIGAFMDAVAFDTICFNSIFMLLCGYFCGVLVATYLNNNFKTSLILSTVISFIYYFTRVCINGFDLELFRYDYIKSIFLTIVFSIPLYAIINLIIKQRKKKLSR